MNNFVESNSLLLIFFLLVMTLKSDSHLPKKFLFIYFNESPLKMMENAFYFILKAFRFQEI